MINYIIIAQLIVALSVDYIWIFRFDNIIKEFKQFGLSDLARNLVGAAKISLSALLIVGIWYPVFVPVSSVGMGLFMVSAQFFHFKNSSPWQKRLPSLAFLSICIFIALASLNIV
jgi:DoxX-like family